jgi:type 1 glutamine amidotransferase
MVLFGGWEEHKPELSAEFAVQRVLGDFDVSVSQDLNLLDPAVLTGVDLLVLLWTFGEIAPAQEEALLAAVEDGLGLLTWHGSTSAFLASRAHKFLTGGQFMAHPGGEHVTYTVNFLDNDPLVEGLVDVTVTSEQYYLLVDPGVKVLATTVMANPGGDPPAVAMPVAWKRGWGQGRVFYCSLGHTPETLDSPSVLSMLRRAAAWASRQPPPAQPPPSADASTAQVTRRGSPRGR